MGRHKLLWSSNFYDGLEYCTVTVKSGLADDETGKTYTVLKGTAITIPNCIFEKPGQSASYFQNWRAKTDHNSNWKPSYCLQDEAYFGTDYTGRNNREFLMKQTYEEPIDPDTQIPQDSERDVMPGETVTIMDNTEFTAVWGSEVKTAVSVVWQDGDDADGLRPGTLKLNYRNPDVTETQTAKAEASDQWSTMIYDVNATLLIDGAETEKDRYSVVKYANVILTGKNFCESYIAGLEKQGKTNLEAKEKYSQLIDLIVAMLDYGSKAQLAFDRDTDHLADCGISVFKDDVTADMIESKSSDMGTNLEQYGLEYQYTAVVFLSKTSLRHYYKMTDKTEFNKIKDSITFNGNSVVPKVRVDLEVIKFHTEDVITTSGESSYPEDEYLGPGVH